MGSTGAESSKFCEMQVYLSDVLTFAVEHGRVRRCDSRPVAASLHRARGRRPARRAGLRPLRAAPRPSPASPRARVQWYEKSGWREGHGPALKPPMLEYEYRAVHFGARRHWLRPEILADRIEKHPQVGTAPANRTAQIRTATAIVPTSPSHSL
jgi:hypothetical protein